MACLTPKMSFPSKKAPPPPLTHLAANEVGHQAPQQRGGELRKGERGGQEARQPPHVLLVQRRARRQLGLLKAPHLCGSWFAFIVTLHAPWKAAVTMAGRLAGRGFWPMARKLQAENRANRARVTEPMNAP